MNAREAGEILMSIEAHPGYCAINVNGGESWEVRVCDRRTGHVHIVRSMADWEAIQAEGERPPSWAGKVRTDAVHAGATTIPVIEYTLDAEEQS